MKEYIEKEKALEALMNCFIDKSWDGNFRYVDARKAVADVPSALVAPVQTSHWVKNWCDNNMIGHEYEECAFCGCSILDTEKFWDAPYCPNCGSKMIKEV